MTDKAVMQLIAGVQDAVDALWEAVIYRKLPLDDRQRHKLCQTGAQLMALYTDRKNDRPETARNSQ